MLRVNYYDLANVSENLFSILFVADTTVLIEGSNINTMIATSRGVVASAPDFERADEGSILTAGICFKSGKSECNNSGYKLTGLTWWLWWTGEVLIRDSWD